MSLQWGPSAWVNELVGGRAAAILFDHFKIGLNNALSGFWVTALCWWRIGCSGPAFPPVILLKGLIFPRNFPRSSALGLQAV